MLRFGSQLEPQRYVLRAGMADQAVRIGRCKQNNVVLPQPGVSWFHAELRLMPPVVGQHTGCPMLCIVDLSTNCTGLRAPGGTVDLLPKNVLIPVQDGSLVVLPMKVKATDTDPRKRMCFRVDYERSPATPQTKTEAAWANGRVDVKVLATRGSGGTTLDFRMRPESNFEKMMQAWCRHHKVADGDGCFRIGDRELMPEDSPASVGWAPGRGILVVEASEREHLEDAVPEYSPAAAPSSFLKLPCVADDYGSPDLIACAEDEQAAVSAQVERERAATLLRRAMRENDEESDHLSGPSPDSSDA